MATTYQRSGDVESAPLDSETIVFSPDANRFCLLNPTAAVLWTALASPQTPESLTAEIQRSFEGVTPEVAARDVEVALQRLRSLSLVVCQD